MESSSLLVLDALRASQPASDVVHTAAHQSFVPLFIGRRQCHIQPILVPPSASFSFFFSTFATHSIFVIGALSFYIRWGTVK